VVAIISCLSERIQPAHIIIINHQSSIITANIGRSIIIYYFTLNLSFSFDLHFLGLGLACFYLQPKPFCSPKEECYNKNRCIPFFVRLPDGLKRNNNNNNNDVVVSIVIVDDNNYYYHYYSWDVATVDDGSNH